MKQKLSLFLGISLLCFALVFSIYQLHPSSAQEKPQVDAVDPEVKAILEKEAELIRKMNEEEEKLKKENKSQEPPLSDTSSPSQVQTVNTTTQSEVEATNSRLSDFNEKLQVEYELGYKPEDYRDPFLPPSTIKAPNISNMQKDQNIIEDSLFDNEVDAPASTNPYTSYYLKTYKISGILWGVNRPKAIVTAPSGQKLSIFIGTRLGREGGVVWAIREKEVVFLLPDKNGEYRNGSPKILRIGN